MDQLSIVKSCMKISMKVVQKKNCSFKEQAIVFDCKEKAEIEEKNLQVRKQWTANVLDGLNLININNSKTLCSFSDEEIQTMNDYLLGDDNIMLQDIFIDLESNNKGFKGKELSFDFVDDFEKFYMIKNIIE